MAIPSYLPQQAHVRAYYALEDVNDGSGNGYNFTNNGPGAFVAAKYDNGWYCSEDTFDLYVASNLGIASSNITALYWVKLDGELGAGASFIGAQHGNNTTKVWYYAYYDYNGGARRIFTARRLYGASVPIVSYTINLGTGWNQLGWSWDGTDLFVWVNGAEATSLTTSGNGSSGPSDYARIGSGSGNAIAIYDEIVYWDAALSGPEVLQFYNGPVTKGGGFSGFSPWMFMKDAWEKHNKIFKPKGILIPKGI